MISCSVINCPEKKKLTVVLSDMLRNTTYSDITNDIRGKGDWLVADGESDTPDYIRRIDLSNVNVVMVRKSHQFFEPMHRDALIVVTQNTTASQLQYSVTRYWKNTYSHWIE
jgi:hypothetical protein